MVARELASTGRVYVEDAGGKLVGVVSIRDVCAEVLSRHHAASSASA